MYRTVEEHLFAEGYAFDFFQAVRLLEKLAPERRPIGREGPPGKEIVRFRNHQSLSFPPSAIHEVEKPTPELAVPAMTVTFMGLTGATGVLPRHYTEMLLRQKDIKTPERFAARDWFDLFNHRILSLFYRAWEKYRFYLLYERGDFAKDAPDPFTRALYSFVGLETRGLRKRLRVEVWQPADLAEEDAHSFARIGSLTSPAYPENRLAGIDDFALVFYGGFLSHRPRSAINLEAMLRDYFQLPLTVEQFHGQWLQLEIDNQSSLAGPNNALGLNTVAGDRVWDVQSKFRVRLGPLRYNQFQDFLPDPSPTPERKAFYLLSHLTRFYVGDEFDFDVQLVLQKEDVPPLQLTDVGMGPRLGWNTWIYSQAMEHDAEDAVFPGQEVVFINRN